MFDVVREREAALVLMHMKGDPKTMQEAPRYDDVVGEVHEYLRQRIEAAELAGIAPDRIAVDPGIGFGKDLDQNLELMRGVGLLLDLGRPVLVGPSRKRFIGAILDLPEDERVEGTIGAVVWMVGRGRTSSACTTCGKSSAPSESPTRSRGPDDLDREAPGTSRTARSRSWRRGPGRAPSCCSRWLRPPTCGAG